MAVGDGNVGVEGYPREALFGCYRIHLNPHVLEWTRVEFSSNSTQIHPNTCGLM